MPEIKLKKRTITGKAVYLLREYARYIDEHAEALIGDIDQPNYITADGIKVSFTLRNDEVPSVNVNKSFLVLNKPRESE